LPMELELRLAMPVCVLISFHETTLLRKESEIIASRWTIHATRA
jgi:hypothetical protein